MNVFIIWSGPRSKEVAVALRNWLPDVMHACEPWISSEDIDPGARWSPELAAQLEQTQFAVICLTPDNLNAPWIHFEAGAISKKLSDKTRVAPYLLDINPTDIVGPLVQFQAVNADPEGTLKLVRSINRASESNALPDDRIEKYFEKYWPELEPILKEIPPNVPEISKPVRDERDLLEEILELVRDQSRVPLAKLLKDKQVVDLCRLYFGKVPSDLTDDELSELQKLIARLSSHSTDFFIWKEASG